MNDRQKNILKELINKEYKLVELADIFGVSDRTIRNDIKSLNEFLKKYDSEIIIKDRKCIFLTSNNFFVTKLKKDLIYPKKYNFNEPKDRIVYLKLKYLFADNYIKLDEIIDELFVSKSTIQNDLIEVKNDLSNYNLNFDYKPNHGMKIVGKEFDIRKAISDLIYNTTNAYKMMRFREELFNFDKVEINTIHNIVVQNISNTDTQLSDLDLYNLTMHLAISMKRIEKGIHINQIISKGFSNNKEHIITKSIIYDLEKEFNIKFPEEELYYITMHLMGTRLIYSDIEEDTMNELEMNELVSDLIISIEKTLEINLSDDTELFYGILTHLYPAIYRMKNNMKIRNPLLNSIKNNYSNIFSACLNSCKEIEDSFNIKLNEDEIGYLTIHFGAAIERLNLENPKLRVLIICTTGLASSQLLTYKIKNRFSNKISIIGTTQYYNLSEYNVNDYDLIISTIAFNNKTSKPHIVISDIFDENSFTELNKYLEKFDNEEKSIYLNPDDIHLNIDFKNKEELIKYLCFELNIDECEKNILYESILEREKISDTDYGKMVAIPHPIKPITEKTFISLGIPKNGINWGKNDVRIIILLSIGKNESRNLEDLYVKLLKILDDDNYLNLILESNDKKQIYKLLNF